MSDYSKEYEPIDNIQCSLGAIEGELDGIRNSINLLVEQYENRKEQMNKDVVSRETVKDLHCSICKESNICYRSKENCCDLKLFDNLPPVTPKQKIVRCEDCRHRDPETKKCDCGCWHFPFVTEDDDFCSYGETKMEGESE